MTGVLIGLRSRQPRCGRDAARSPSIRTSDRETCSSRSPSQGLRAVLVDGPSRAPAWARSLMMASPTPRSRVNPVTKTVATVAADRRVSSSWRSTFVVRGSSESAKFRSEVLLDPCCSIALDPGFTWAILGVSATRRAQTTSRSRSRTALGARGVMLAVRSSSPWVIVHRVPDALRDQRRAAGRRVTGDEVRPSVWCGSSSVTSVDGVGPRPHQVRQRGPSPWAATRKPSRQVGVPAARTKTQLFMIVSVGRLARRHVAPGIPAQLASRRPHGRRRGVRVHHRRRGRRHVC